jgi:hypothetical protein
MLAAVLVAVAGRAWRSAMTDRCPTPGEARGARPRTRSRGGSGEAAGEPGRARDPRALGLDDAPELAIVGHDEDAPRAGRAVGPELGFNRRFQHAIGRAAAGMLDEEVLSGSREGARAGDSDIARAIEYELDAHLGRKGGAN